MWSPDQQQQLDLGAYLKCTFSVHPRLSNSESLEVGPSICSFTYPSGDAGGPQCWTNICLFIDTAQVLFSIFLLSLLTTEVPLRHF